MTMVQHIDDNIMMMIGIWLLSFFSPHQREEVDTSVVWRKKVSPAFCNILWL